MINTKRVLLFLAAFALLSCGQKDPNKQIDEDKVEGETYTSHEIGRTIQIPIVSVAFLETTGYPL